MKRLKRILSWPVSNARADEVWVNAFADWFGSVGGFKSQLIVMVGWVAIILAFPFIDPSMLHLMCVLTIYSAITQPMLAIGNTRSIQRIEAKLDAIESKEDHILDEVE